MNHHPDDALGNMKRKIEEERVARYGYFEIAYPVRLSTGSGTDHLMDARDRMLGTMQIRDALNEGHRHHRPTEDDIWAANKAMLDMLGRRVDDLIMKTARVGGCNPALAALGAAIAAYAVAIKSPAAERKQFADGLTAALREMEIVEMMKGDCSCPPR